MSTIQDLYNDFKSLCKQWFYEKSEVDTALSGKQATLVSGTNIKTINNTSLLGSGNIDVSGGGGSITVDDALSTTSTNPVQNKVIKSALDGKSNTNHDHNIFDLNQTTQDGANALMEGADVSGQGIGLFDNIIVYSLADAKVYYLDNGSDSNQELAVKGDIPSFTVEQQAITVTSATSGSNYFSGGTREITAVKYGKIVNVTVNFYGVGAKQASTSTDTTIGTLPTGWKPKITQYCKPAFNTNTNQNYASCLIDTSGNIKIRIGSTTTLSNVTFRFTMTFITA